MTAPEQAREALISRLLAHAAIHDAHTPHDDEQQQWADDLREAAAALSAQEAPQAMETDDERAAFTEWLTTTYPKVYTAEDADQYWMSRHVAVLAWIARGRLTAAPAAPKQAEAQPWGWAIVDKNGDGQFTRPRLSRLFGAENTERPPIDASDLAYADREWPGLAPHRIVTLYAAPAAPQD